MCVTNKIIMCSWSVIVAYNMIFLEINTWDNTYNVLLSKNQSSV